MIKYFGIDFYILTWNNTKQSWIVTFWEISGNNSKSLTELKKQYIIYKHELSDEVKCGYILTEMRNGGNFNGVCHGKDQAVSLYFNSTYPKIIMHVLGFYIGDIQNTRVRFNLPR